MWLVEELLLVKLSFQTHCFPNETDPGAVGFSPASCLIYQVLLFFV